MTKWHLLAAGVCVVVAVLFFLGVSWTDIVDCVRWDAASNMTSGGDRGKMERLSRYLAAFPNGLHSAEARKCLTELAQAEQALNAQMERDWKNILSATPSDLKTLLPAYFDKSRSDSPAVEYFRKNQKETIAGMLSTDPVTRAHYALYAAERGARGVLFTPYLIELLNDATRLQVLSGPAVGPKSQVGETTVGDRAQYALTHIHYKEMLSGVLEKPTEQAISLGQNKEAWEKWWTDWWVRNREQFR